MADTDRDEPDGNEDQAGPPFEGDVAAPSAQLFRQLFDRIPAELALFDAAGRFVYVSESAVRDPAMRRWLVGRTEHEYCRHRGIDPAVADRRLAARQHAADRGEAVSFEETLSSPRGSRHYRRSLVPLIDAEGRVSHYAGFGFEITERRAIEDAVRESEQKYRNLFEQTRDIVYISTADGRMVDMNQAGLELLGFADKRELLELDYDLYVDPWERVHLRRLLGELGFVKDLEIHVKTRRGEHLVVEVTATAIRDELGAVTTHLGVLRDVTASRRLDQQLRQSQKMEAVGRVARGLSHEFNNLLTTINGYSDLLLQKLAASDDNRDYVERIGAAGRQAAMLIGQLVTLSHPTTIATLTLDLNQVLRYREGVVRQVVGEDVEVVMRLQPDLDNVRFDPSQIEQVVLNLALNARDAMPTGGRLVIETCNRTLDAAEAASIGAAAGSWVCLSVRDNGSGIAPEVREHMFEPFYSTKDNVGSGLGLSTVYGIVRQSGGYIDVEASDESQGTVFHLFLPTAVGSLLATDG